MERWCRRKAVLLHRSCRRMGLVRVFAAMPGHAGNYLHIQILVDFSSIAMMNIRVESNVDTADNVNGLFLIHVKMILFFNVFKELVKKVKTICDFSACVASKANVNNNVYKLVQLLFGTTSPSPRFLLVSRKTNS